MADVSKGRGALSNPHPRFNRERIERVDDGWYLQEDDAATVPTSVEIDRSRSIITTNDSPDVPFEYSINPYRGCEHSCVYCLGAETPILMGDGRTRPISLLKAGDEIYGTARRGQYLRYVKTRVLAHWSVIKPGYRITLEDGTKIVAGGDHRFLTDRGWKFVIGTMGAGELQRPHLTTRNKLTGTGAFASAVTKDHRYKLGYLCGMIRGDALLRSYSYGGIVSVPRLINQFRLALCDREGLYRTRDYLSEFDVSSREFLFQGGTATRRPMYGIRSAASASFHQVRVLIEWPPAATSSWCAGFLAGIFDAEGSCSQGVLRISNTDRRMIDWIGRCLDHFHFRFALERRAGNRKRPIEVVRLIGGLRERLRFLHTVDPAISRKFDIEGRAVKSDAPLRVVSIERLSGALRLYDITTGTGDFIANGVVSHNCYARPSHAYLGLSPGIDFETRLFYKPDAAKLLEAELARPGYVCKPIALGTNTDPYQPVERRLGVMRSILEVLARCRHPVTIVTKAALVLRDLDLLADLARDGLASVAISVTTLDAAMKRNLEPRAASPQARLRAIRELNQAGVPTGVMVAPVIPALTDHEMEAIVDAAADAGARWAAYVVLRLPHEVKELFREWLAHHHPQRARHVMSVVQSLRGGRDNDPRFGSRMCGEGPFAELLRARFQLACRRRGLDSRRILPPPTTLFVPPRPSSPQLRLDL